MERAFFLLICLTQIYGGDFIFSANLSTKNLTLNHQEISISPLMLGELTNNKFLCKLPKKHENQNELRYLYLHEDKLLECFISEEISVISQTKSKMLSASSNAQMTFLPVKFKLLCKKDFCEVFLP